MKNYILPISLLFFISPFTIKAQCTIYDATDCQCLDPSQVDCDLLPDISLSWYALMYQSGNGTGAGPSEYALSGEGDNNGRLRKFSSSRVQGTTFAMQKSIFSAINGFGEWTEKYSCGVDSDFWMKMYQYYLNHKIKVCYTNKLKTYDSFSKRWGKFTKLFRNYKIKKEFNKIYNCINYKDKKYNLARNKSLWIEDLIEK